MGSLVDFMPCHSGVHFSELVNTSVCRHLTFWKLYTWILFVTYRKVAKIVHWSPVDILYRLTKHLHLVSFAFSLPLFLSLSPSLSLFVSPGSFTAKYFSVCFLRRKKASSYITKVQLSKSRNQTLEQYYILIHILYSGCVNFPNMTYISKPQILM